MHLATPKTPVEVSNIGHFMLELLSVKVAQAARRLLRFYFQTANLDLHWLYRKIEPAHKIVRPQVLSRSVHKS